MKTYMNKKILPIILVITTFLTMIPLSPLTAKAITSPGTLTVTYNDEKAENVTIKENEKVTLSAKLSKKADDISYQWQVLADEENSLWVNISGMTEQSESFTYAVLSSVIDMSGSAYVRCVADVGGEEVYSEPVCTTISFNAKINDNAGSQPSANNAVKPKKAAAKADAAEDYVYITINYKDAASGDVSFSPYTGQIERGTDFQQTVISPTFLGFAPFYNPKDPPAGYDPETTTTNAGTVLLDYKNLQEDVEINVYYVAVAVNYAARYFFQNIHDDLYTERLESYYQGTEITGTIIGEEVLAEHAGDTTGFSKLYHYPEAVAADGSTVFECYYDRNYYLMKFDMDGGYGVEPVYARYETPFVINQPTKHGYVFIGWDLLDKTDENGEPIGDGVPDTVPSTIPAESLSYKAIWETAQTTVDYVYWKQNANSDEYSYWGHEQRDAQSSTTVNGEDRAAVLNLEDHQYFNFNSEKTDKNVIVDGDGSTVVNVYYDRKVYTQNFFYARSRVQNGETVYQVVGGTTYYFGKLGGNPNASIGERLGYVADDQWGRVKSKPTVNEKYAQRYKDLQLEYGGYTYYYLSYEARYGQDLTDLWPIGIFNPVSIDETHNSHRPCFNNAYFSAWNGEYKVKYTQDNENQTIKGLYKTLDKNLLFDTKQFSDSSVVSYLGFWDNGADISWSVPKLFKYEIYLQNLDGSYSDQPSISIDTYDNSTPGEQTPPSITSFELQRTENKQNADTADGMDSYTMKYYYERKSYKIDFYDFNEFVRQETLKYGESYDKYIDYKPDYPDTLEPGAYSFAGWYTTPGCYPGSELKKGMTVKTDTILYAKWAPVKHTVNFFRSYDDMLMYEASVAAGTPDNSLIYQTKDIEHGSVYGPIDQPPPKIGGETEYTFSGWFHIHEGERDAFTPLDSPVNMSMNVFADWGSHTAQPYRIDYVLSEDHTTPVADPTEGYAYQGSTRTFNAKTGEPYNQLYMQYNSGYFPLVSSHSITIQYEENKLEPKHNVYTFEYVKAANIEYTVRYVDKITGLELAPEVKKTTSKGVVTERFEQIPNYVPDAFYKRLIISVEKDENGNIVGTPENEIVFYYTPSETTAFYAVHYMMQKTGTTGDNYKIDGSGDYIESTAGAEGVGDIGQTISIEPPMFTGFTADMKNGREVIGGGEPQPISADTNGQFNIQITGEGTELYIFYKRNSYGYQVQYIDYNTRKELHDPKQGEKKPFGATVTEKPIAIEGYKPISADSQSLLIRADEDKNIITFYYIPEQYTIEYIAVGGGTLSNTNETVTGHDNPLQGSTPTADIGYRFEGWYKDEACTIPVGDKATVDKDGKIIPDLLKLDPAPETNTFYAKFEELRSDLTITRTNSQDEGNGDQVYVYKVTNLDDPSIVVYATVQGNGSTTINDLRQGNYSVEQLNDWSWRYSDEKVEIKLTENPREITFSKEASIFKWLNGNSIKVTNRKGETQ